MDSSSTRSTAIIGAGTIGLSWASLFAAHGWDVRVSDPRPDLQQAIDDAIAGAVPALKALGMHVDAHDLATRVAAASSLEKAVDGVDIVQENGPERVDWKRDLFAKLVQITGNETVLATSSSSIPAGQIIRDIDDASRIIVGHPYNPPHIIPVVEVVPSTRTSQDTIQRAVAIYRSLGRTPILVKKEIDGFVGNRLQLALQREALYLVQNEVIDPVELDQLMRGSLGLRWAAVGPLAAMRLGGGPAGAMHLMETVGKEMEHIEFQSLGPDETINAVSAVDKAYGNDDYASASKKAGQAQISLLKTLKGT